MLILGALGFSLILPSAAARASPVFPPTIASELDLEAPPECTLCHNNPAGGFGTATKPFAKYMRSRGLRATDVDSLSNALKAAEGEESDVDDDGVSDIDELIEGDDPNSAAHALPAPSYGCAIAAVHTAQNAGLAPMLGFALIVLLRGRRRMALARWRKRLTRPLALCNSARAAIVRSM